MIALARQTTSSTRSSGQVGNVAQSSLQMPSQSIVVPGVGFDVVQQHHPLRLRLGVTSSEGGEDIDLAGGVEVVDAVWVN